MLLALDVGNTNITIGAFDGIRVLKGRWRLRTIREQTPDEWGILLRNLFSLSSLDLPAIDGVVISSVVPGVDQPLAAMAERYFSGQPLFVTQAIDLGMRLRYDNPREVGADRLVNAVAGFAVTVARAWSWIWGPRSTSMSWGRGTFLGGRIGPGIGMSICGLFARTARLPMVDFREPETSSAPILWAALVGSLLWVHGDHRWPSWSA